MNLSLLNVQYILFFKKIFVYFREQVHGLEEEQRERERENLEQTPY